MKRSKEDDAEEGDEDQDFLDRVLNKLYDFGDGSKSNRSKKKNKSRERVDDEEEETAGDVEDSDKPSGIKDKSDLNHTIEANQDKRISVSTSCDSKSRGPAIAPDVEIVTFQDPLKKNKLKRASELDSTPPKVQNKKKKNSGDDELTIEKARLEVHRFGITGFQKHQQRVFEEDRAIMLGARPPKKQYVNYKVYQQMIKEKKLKEKEEKNPDTTVKKKSGKSGKQKTEKRKPGSGSEPAGQVGRFKNGMLVLSNKDIHKLKVKVKK